MQQPVELVPSGTADRGRTGPVLKLTTGRSIISPEDSEAEHSCRVRVRKALAAMAEI
jgi:hypothetical protein